LDTLLTDLSGASEAAKIFILATSTLVSEDLTTILAGILVSQEALHPITAVLGCFLGIFIGDGALYVVGKVIGRPALKLPILRNMLPEEKVLACARWFENNGMKVVIISRFLPGTRLPTYFAAGLVGANPITFLSAAGLAVALWTPALVYASYLFGEELLALTDAHEQYRWPIMIGGLLMMFALVRVSMKLGDWRIRARLYSRFRRLIDWEFWPLPIFYAPVLIYNLLLAVRYRRTDLPFASNPGIEGSGFVGESKSEILSAIREGREHIARYVVVPPGSPEDRMATARDWMRERSLELPIILKPDIGQRGDGVSFIRDEAAMRAYFEKMPYAVLAQEVASGPIELGVFYRRYPDRDRGEVLGLTGKEMPWITGDGASTVEELILRHPRTPGRAHIFRARFGDRLSEILPAGETLRLVTKGNHCLGTVFVDASDLLTPALEERIEQISRSMPGFFIGRFDIRARSIEALKAGEDFAIIELNGSSAEPGHMYDKRYNIFRVYGILFAMYRDLWRIGAQNARNGFQPTTPWDLWRAQRRYAREHRMLTRGRS